MGLVERSHRSGVVLVEETSDGAWLRRALKEIDPQLRLLDPRMVQPGTPTGYWRVVAVWANDRPPVPVLTWMDANGAPILQLTSGILEEVRRLRMDARNRGPSAEERNQQLIDRVRADREAAREALHDEYEPYLERERVGVSLGARNRVPYWQRKYRGGER